MTERNQMNGALQPEATTSRISQGKATILIVGSEPNQLMRVQKELQNAGYAALPAADAPEALRFITSQPIQLVIAIGQCGSQTIERRSRRRSLRSRSEFKTGSRTLEQRNLERITTITSAARASRVPVMVIGSLWAEASFAWILRTGADYFLLSPYQPADLLRTVHETLLNGPVLEPVEVLPGVEIIHQDRTHLVTTGRVRLARLGFAVFEELRQSRSAQSWSQAEVQDLRQQLRQERERSCLALQIPEVVQGIGHDFSNLLETVSASAHLLRSGPENPRPFRDAMDAALRQAAMLLATLQDWTEWKEEGSDAEPIELAEAAQEVLDAALLSVRAPKIRVRLQMDRLPPARISRPLLIRTLSNLVWNAVEAMPDGGMLTLLAYLDRSCVVLEVSDTGVGIAEADQEKIFAVHHTTKRGHAGIGLPLVRSLVQRAGGRITFASRPGRGTTFTFSLPLAEMERAAAHPEKRNRKVAVG